MENKFLNPRQIKATEHKDGPMMVLAGPGSGKTTVITYRIRYLIEKYEVAPTEIVVITFTKAAAEEMKARFFKLWPDGCNSVFFGTFHSFFYRILRRYYHYELKNIIKDEQRRVLLLSIMRSLGLTIDNEEDFLQNLAGEISYIKNDLIDLKYYHSNTFGSDDFLSIYKAYEAYKEENSLIDFDDMLVKCYDLLLNNSTILERWQQRYRYILIDEFQDINRVQYECIRLLAAPLYNLFVVGDDDQSIYKFRGARPEFFLRFPKDFERVRSVTLDINYRSTDQIIRLCNRVIAVNKERYEKKISGTGREGNQPQLLTSEDIGAEAMNVAGMIKSMLNKANGGLYPSSIAVLYRTNIQSRALVDAFMDMHIPFHVRDQTPTIYEHWISKDLCAYLRLSQDQGSNDALERIINKPTRFIQKALVVAARKKPGALLQNLFTDGVLPDRQLMLLEELTFYLDAIKKRGPYDAVKYIRKAIGYDQYVRQYADYRKMKSVGFLEILDELQESAKAYPSIAEYLVHVDEILREAVDTVREPEEKKEGVLLSTLHSAKGLEFEIVFIAGAVEGVLPHEKSKTEAEIEEERRLFYVGMTRAKTSLYISILKTRYEEAAAPTRFLQTFETHAKGRDG